jgi:hypothetical protein
MALPELDIARVQRWCAARALTFTKISDPCNSVRSEILSHVYIHIR